MDWTKIASMKTVAARGSKAETINYGPGFPFDPAEDSPELEAELLKGMKGPFTPYSRKEMKAMGERIIREKRRT